MRADHVSESQVRAVAESIGLRVVDTRNASSARTTRVQFRLGLGDYTNGLGTHTTASGKEVRTAKYNRLNHRLSRRVGAVCWHGHRDFFRALFEAHPEAVVRVSGRFNNGDRIVYTSVNFEATFEVTGDRNIGSMFEPCQYRDACVCDE